MFLYYHEYKHTCIAICPLFCTFHPIVHYFKACNNHLTYFTDLLYSLYTSQPVNSMNFSIWSYRSNTEQPSAPSHLQHIQNAAPLHCVTTGKCLQPLWPNALLNTLAIFQSIVSWIFKLKDSTEVIEFLFVSANALLNMNSWASCPSQSCSLHKHQLKQ